MTPRHWPPLLHARLTVVRADGATAELAEQLAAALVGDAVDLRLSAAGPPVVITGAAIQDHAAQRAALDFDRRVAARDEAVAHRSGIATRRTDLLGRAEWCEETAVAARAMTAADADADGRVAAARADAEAAAARRDRVAEQRAAAQVALDQARLELEALDGAALDETGVRRELEAATRAERDAAGAVDAADAEVAALQARLAELDAAEQDLAAARDRLAERAAEDDIDAAGEAAVREALAVYDELAERVSTDPGATALADAIARVEAELTGLRERLPEPPTDGQLEGAEADVAAARRHVDAARAAASSFSGPPPEWWTELTSLHTAVVDTEAALSSAGLRKNAARRRYEEAVAAERACLDELGFASYLDALMSGGRRPDERAVDDRTVADAQTRLADAKRTLECLRGDLVAGAPIVGCIEERQRLLGVTAGLLGCDPGDRAVELLTEHPAIPPMAIGDLAAALRSVGVPTAGVGVAAAARRWLRARDETRDPLGRADVDRQLAEIAAERRTLENALGPARAVAERATAAAVAAGRTVASFEAELRDRAGDDARLLERATAAGALREQVEAVEAHLARAETDALDAWAAAIDALSATEAERDRIEGELADLARRAARAAAELPPERRPAFDLLSGLAPLGAALRAEVLALAAELELADQAVADADAACGLDARTPTVADLEAGVRAAVAAAPAGVPLVFSEPFASVPSGEVEQLLDVVLDATAERPTIVVTAELSVVGWAIGLPLDVGALVSARSLDAILTTPAVRAPMGRQEDPRAAPHPH